MADIVVVRNKGKKDLHLAYNSKATVVPVGGEALVDRECAAIYFGDWTKRNDTTRRERTRPHTRRCQPCSGVHSGREAKHLRSSASFRHRAS